MAALLLEANRQLRSLDAISQAVPGSYGALFAVQEAVFSSRLEGIPATVHDAFMRYAGLAIRGGAWAAEACACADAILECAIPGPPVSRRDMQKAHATLQRGVNDTVLTPGRFRTVQNWIGRPGAGMEQATYVPPAADRLDGLVSNLESFMAQNGRMPISVKCAILHHQFEAIHPFIDGNGRTGRLLVQAALARSGSLRLPLLCMSRYLLENVSQYHGLLLDVSQNGSWNEWVAFFLHGLIQSCRDSVRQAVRLYDIHQVHREAVSGRHAALLDCLFGRPIITDRMASHMLNAGAQKTLDALAAFEGAEILEPLDIDVVAGGPGGAGCKVYKAARILGACQESSQSLNGDCALFPCAHGPHANPQANPESATPPSSRS